MSLSYNIKTDGLAVGDGQLATPALTISGTPLKSVASTTNLWVSGDAGKVILIDGVGAGGNQAQLLTTIATFVDAQHITLTDAATVPLSAVPTLIAWGTDDSAAFARFNTAGRAASGQVTLTIPQSSPSSVYMTASTTPNVYKWCRGIPQLKVTWDGLNRPTLAGNIDCGTFTFPTSSDCSARIATAKSGDTTLQLLHVADGFKFQPGRTLTQNDGTVYISGTRGFISALDMQGTGDPNHFYREFIQFTNVNLSTGLITLVAPLKTQYLSTFPLYNEGGPPGPSEATDCGGPATIYIYDASWDAVIEFVGIQFCAPGNLINGQVRTITFSGPCKWLGGLGPTQSNNETWTVNGGDLSTCLMEADKNVTTLNIISTAVHVGWFQSASTDNLLIDSTTMDQLKGTVKNTTVNNSTITTVDLGPTGFGRADTFHASNSTFGAINYLFADQLLPNPPTVYSCVGGRITVTGSFLPRWAVPGTLVFAVGLQEGAASFNVLALSGDGDPFTDASHKFIDTDLKNGWPNIPLASGGTAMFAVPHPAPLITFINCTGCDDARDFSNPGAQGKPAFSYSNRTYAGGASGAVIALVNPVYIPTEGPRLWGKIVSVKVTVGVAFTTAGALSLNLFGRFVTNANDPLTGTTTTWIPVVDLKTPGTRTITATTFNNLGADNLGPSPGSIFFSGRQIPYINGTVTGGDPGTVTIEVETDQGLLTMSRNMKGDF